MPNNVTLLLDTAETADYINTTPRHVRRLRQERLLPATKVGGKVRFHRDDVDAYIAACREKS